MPPRQSLWWGWQYPSAQLVIVDDRISLIPIPDLDIEISRTSTIHDEAHAVMEHGLDLLSHRVQAYHVASVMYSTLGFRYEDAAVHHGNLYA